MYKVSTFLAEGANGYSAIPLFGAADSVFEKTAAASLMPEVLRYIETLKPKPGSQYVLVNAMGAGEVYGSNINGDFFEESGLIHRPSDWAGDPLVDKEEGKKWTYGFPTFYNAFPYKHHQNKDSSRAYGEVELASWNPTMRRVELVCRIDEEKCNRFNGQYVWDKLCAGQFPDVSMGSKVCYDLSSITTDWGTYNKALKTYDPKKFAYPGLAVLEYHKKLKRENGVGIRGLSITRADYDEWTRNHMNKILPDGRKVWVYNPYPRFFDISFVFIGADRTAKTMVFIVRKGDSKYIPSAVAGEKIASAQGRILDAHGEPMMKAASADSISDRFMELAFGKDAADKNAEIEKEIPADAGSVLLQKSDKDLPPDALKALSAVPPEAACGTTASMGIVLKPKEFQRIILTRAGKGDLASDLAEEGKVFPAVDEVQDMDLKPNSFMPALAQLLMPLLAGRSALGPYSSTRVIMIKGGRSTPETSHNTKELRKISAAYNGYRQSLMDMVATAQDKLPLAAPADETIAKLASAKPEQVFTPLTFSYLKEAHRPSVMEDQTCQREEGTPLTGHVRGAENLYSLTGESK